MGLYLCVFSSPLVDDEIEGVEVGSYADFDALRSAVSERLENHQWGSRFPVLMLHSDSEGVWTPQEARALGEELATIKSEFRDLAPMPFTEGSWQKVVAKQIGIHPSSLAESFIDVDGEALLPRLIHLASISVERNCPISFQ